MVFSSNSKFRLYVVRFLAVAFFGVLMFVGVSLLFFLTRATTDRPPVTYSSVIEYFHYSHAPSSAKKIVLTFDDGPDPVYTEHIADTLEKYRIPGAFFFIGEYLLLYPGIARNIHERGFEIGNHTFTHSHAIDSSRRRFGLELASTDYLLQNITGETPRYYRPPYLLDVATDDTINPFFDYKEESVFWPLTYGYIPVGADIDSLDWKTERTDKVLNFVAGDTDQGGHIVLLHSNKSSAESLEKIILYLQNRGYTFVTLDELLIPPEYAVLTRDMRRGDTNATSAGEVSLLQWFLYRQGHLDPYALSGVFDKATEEALTAYQATEVSIGNSPFRGAANGILDQHTRERIAPIPIGIVSPPLAPPTSSFSSDVQQFSLWAMSGILAVVPLLLFLALSLVVFRILVVISLYFYTRLQKKKNARVYGPVGPVSVIIPAWNEEQNVEATIVSVIQNTGVIKEIIVVDDGSVDTTATIVQKVIAQNPKERIKLVSVPNEGKARALNRGIASAFFDIVVTMDSDSIFTAHSIEKMVRHFADPAVGAVGGKVCTTHLRTFLDHIQSLEYLIGQNIEKRLLSSVNAVGVIPGPIGAWRKSVLKKAGGFSGDTLVEDQDMTLAVLSLGYRVVYEPEAVAYTETPHKLSDFMKQRFRWVYGSVQCFWKYKSIMLTRPLSGVASFVLPNILLYSILLPLTYPIIDLTLIWGIMSGLGGQLFYAAVLFTVLDMLYAYAGIQHEKNKFRLLTSIPLARLFYRQIIYYIVIRSVVRAFEGSGLEWHSIKKSGATQKFFLSTIEATPN